MSSFFWNIAKTKLLLPHIGKSNSFPRAPFLLFFLSSTSVYNATWEVWLHMQDCMTPKVLLSTHLQWYLLSMWYLHVIPLVQQLYVVYRCVFGVRGTQEIGRYVSIFLNLSRIHTNIKCWRTSTLHMQCVYIGNLNSPKISFALIWKR